MLNFSPSTEENGTFKAYLLAMLLKGMCVGSGCSLLKSQYTGQVGGKESLLYFICQQLAGAAAAICSKANVHPHDKQVVRVL